MTRTKVYKRANKLLLPEKKQPKDKPVVPKLQDLPVSVEQGSKALKALVAHVKARPESTQLLSNEEWVELVITTRKMQPRERHMPYWIPLPHPLMDPRSAGVCLFVKDPADQYKKLLEQAKITFVSKVIGVEKLKGKYKSFEARRQLRDTYSIFLADDRVVPMLPKLLGKQWLDRKKQPLPVSMKPSSLKARLETILSSTSLFIPQGTCITVRIGTLNQHTSEQLLDNLKATIPQLAIRIPDGWDNIQALHVKTSTSISLPIWNASMELVEPTSMQTADDEFATAEHYPDLDVEEEAIQNAIQQSGKAPFVSKQPISAASKPGSRSKSKAKK